MENVGRPVLDSLPVAPAAPLRPVPFAANDPPQEIQQLHALVEQFRRNHNFQAVLTVAMMYQRGAYPRLRPNDVLASELCLAVATHPAAPRDVGNQAARLYMEVFASPVLADDRAGEEMPTGPARTMLRLLGDMQPIVPDETYPMLNGMLNMDHEIALALAMEGDGNGDDPFAVPDLHSQNSHDHGVVRAVQSTLMALPTFDGDDHHVVRQVRDQISAQRELSNAERRDAAKVLDAVRANPKDVEALGKVWQRIQDEPDPEVRSNRIETLGKQLASGVEDGHVVCSTGRISRMVAALQGQDEPDDAVVRIRSTNNVAQELMQMAAYVRDQVLTDASHVDRMDYGTGAGQTQFLSDEMAKRFREKVNATYVQEMGMSPAVLEPILEPLIASF